MKISRSDWLLYSIAVISAIAVVALVYTYIEKRVADAQKNIPVKTVTVVEKPELAPVLIASRDLYRGEKIAAEDVKVLNVAKEGIVIKGIYAKPEQAVGQIVRQDLYAGEWLFAKKFTDKIADKNIQQIAGVSSLIKPGMRAMRIPVSPESGLLGILKPGDHVDVASVFNSANGKRQISRVILQNIEVLSIGQESRYKPKSEIQEVVQSGTKKDETAVKRSMVALHLTIQQAEKLALAISIGKLNLLLRNEADTEIKESDGVNVRVIESDRQKRVEHSAKDQRQTVQLLQGGEVQEVKVP
ncbi:Flp pilus assembly protein CpaB [Thiomicrorhabdus sp. 6S2-11]|uniref:Flp pilus assembly protein CpaB n=1 Tax=Thiomicrorhabdus marina TaxID=2818442 RepID=A0ABS3Q6V8_9GAMM|nr:Flp pilus assembly protein CpaB [Thiomicrorhabdus marina]MBO1927684.1 Flp pilus assembly protein CpaB [Thiomicrorhabdus marina]